MWRKKHVFYYFLAYFYMKRSRSRWKKVPGAGAGQKWTGSATLPVGQLNMLKCYRKPRFLKFDLSLLIELASFTKLEVINRWSWRGLFLAAPAPKKGGTGNCDDYTHLYVLCRWWEVCLVWRVVSWDGSWVSRGAPTLQTPSCRARLSGRRAGNKLLHWFRFFLLYHSDFHEKNHVLIV